MTSKDEVFRAWAPDDARWSPWVKPLLFAHVDGLPQTTPVALPARALAHADVLPGTPLAPYREAPAISRWAVVVDLAGAASVRVGVAFAELGYQPVPIFSCLPPDAALDVQPFVDAWPTLAALIASAPLLAGMTLRTDAPPVFLLDRDRCPALDMTKTDPLRPWFENRALAHAADFPSAERLRRAGIDSVLFVHHAERPAVSDDLAYALDDWRGAGIAFYSTDLARDRTPRPITLPRPTLVSRAARLFSELAIRKPGPVGTAWLTSGSHAG